MWNIGKHNKVNHPVELMLSLATQALKDKKLRADAARLAAVLIAKRFSIPFLVPLLIEILSTVLDRSVELNDNQP